MLRTSNAKPWNNLPGISIFRSPGFKLLGWSLPAWFRWAVEHQPAKILPEVIEIWSFHWNLRLKGVFLFSVLLVMCLCRAWIVIDTTIPAFQISAEILLVQLSIIYYRCFVNNLVFPPVVSFFSTLWSGSKTQRVSRGFPALWHPRTGENSPFIVLGKNTFARWWFQIFLFFTPTWENDPIWRAYFSSGLKPPTSLGRPM